MKPNYSIGVIVPAYNTSSFIQKCLNSIKNQTYVNFRAIVVDDGSNDDTGLICDNFSKNDNRFVVFHTKNNGPGEARNLALKYINDFNEHNDNHIEYITFIDSDDYVSPRYLENLIMTILNYGADIVSTPLVTVYDRSYSFDYIDNHPVVLDKNNSILMLCDDEELKSYFCGKIFAYSLFKDNSFESYTKYEDYKLMHYVLDGCNKLCLSASKIYFYYQNSNSTTGQNNPMTSYNHFEAILDRIRFCSIKYPKALFTLYNKLISVGVGTYLNILKKDPDSFGQELKIIRKELSKSFLKIFSCKKVSFKRKAEAISIIICPFLVRIIIHKGAKI